MLLGTAPRRQSAGNRHKPVAKQGNGPAYAIFRARRTVESVGAKYGRRSRRKGPAAHIGGCKTVHFMKSTELTLLDRLRLAPGDADAWQRLVEIYQSWLRGWLLAEALQPADADDVVQEVLAVVCRELPSFRHNGRAGAFRAWLRGIVVNRLREFRRQRRPQAAGPADIDQRLDQLADEQSESSRQWDRQHDQNLVNRLLRLVAADFAPATMQAFRAFVVEERPAAVVARELGITEGAVWTAKSRVLKRLRQAAQEMLD